MRNKISTACAPCRLSAILAVCLCLAAGMAHAQSSLDDRVAGVIAQNGLRQGDVGVYVVEVGTGRVLYDLNGAGRFVPASNQKLITAAAALMALGPDYEFRTAAYARGSVVNGVLQGNLVVRGGGNPTLGGKCGEEDPIITFRRWAHVLQSKGIRAIAGDVVVDDTFFDRTWRHPDWSSYPVTDWYYTPAGALSVNDNCVTITVQSGGASGAPALVTVTPASAPVRVQVTCVTAAVKRPTVWFGRQEGSNLIVVGGKVGRASYSGMCTVPEPPLYAACVLKEAFEAEGLTVGGRARVIGAGEAGPAASETPLVERRTALLPVLRLMAKESHNHYAEQVMKTIGAEAGGCGTWTNAGDRVAAALRAMGLSPDECNIADGSGLSKSNEVTPRLLASLLAQMATGPYAQTYEALLPLAGEDGTLEKRMTEPPYRGNVRAKTGYLTAKGSLSGYATTAAGTQVAFSIIVNDHTPGQTPSMRDTTSGICRAIVDCAR